MTIKERFAAWYAARFLSFKEVWGKFTGKWNVFLISAGVAWNFLPADAQTKIVESVLAALHVPTSWAVVAIGVVGFLLRIKKQDPKE